ncbi:MAG: GxxExxY protein [Bacteroidia bacterium]
MKKEVKREDLIYSELSYAIIGCAYSVYNEIGPGHLERVYQKALAIALRKAKIFFTEQYHVNVVFMGEKLGNGYVDFLIEKIIILELKRDIKSGIAYLKQVLNYMHSAKIPLAILINFTHSGVITKRIVLEEYYSKEGIHMSDVVEQKPNQKTSD